MNVNSSNLKDSLKNGVKALEENGFLQRCESGIRLDAIQGSTMMVEKHEDTITITYDTEPHFYMALARSIVIPEGKHVIEAKAKRLGFMLDCSRNAVSTPRTVKELICLLVMAGYDYLELYTEDTYELPDEPYFGYKRGRYSAEELEEIVAFADRFRFGVVPCIQTLAHLKTLANWKPYYDHMDIDDVLLTGDERTYRLIRKCIRFWKEICHTKRINIGSDEAYRQGRGKYTDIYGYKSTPEVYLEHMKKVFEICKEEGVEPEFWADAFYDSKFSKEEVENLFDGTQLPIVWRYRYTEAEQLHDYLPRCKEYAGKVMFACAAYRCYSYAPENLYSQRSIDALFDVAWQYGVDDVLLTAWGNDGSGCSAIAIMPTIWYAAQKLYPCDVDLECLLYELTGYTKAEWEVCDKLNYVMPGTNRQTNAAKYLLYNDFLIGLLDYNIPDHAAKIYQDLLPGFRVLAERGGRFSYLFAVYEAQCRVLTRKATFSKRLYKAYQEDDRTTIRSLIEELPLIAEDLKEFIRVYRIHWMTEYKGFGFEVIDIRIGGLIARIDTVISVLNDYLDGKTERIYELDEKRIEYFCNQLKGEDVYSPFHCHWGTAYTVNIVY